MILKSKRILTIALFFTAAPIALLQAQQDDFQSASRLMQQQNYEQALPILEQLYTGSPERRIYFEKLVECLVQLNRLSEALRLTNKQLAGDGADPSILILRGDIQLRMGEREAAFDTWQRVLNENNRDLSLNFQVGNAMMNRREFRAAAEHYRSARSAFGDETLFSNEIVASLMQAGEFTEALEELIQMVKENPGRSGIVKQRLIQFQDPDMLKLAAEELEAHLPDIDKYSRAYTHLHELHLWLLMETEQFEKAFRASLEQESNSQILSYSLFSLASDFADSRQFELAEKAYRFYKDSSDRQASHRASDQLGELYMQWADQLRDHTLDRPSEREKLYRLSYEVSTRLLEEAPEYNRRNRVISRLAELALDLHFDPSGAGRWIDQIEVNGDDRLISERHWLEGRVDLLQQSWREARQSFTRALQTTDYPSLTEKYHYYLSLSEFLSGDFEYALLQLRSLERRSDSRYANDALKLRMWIQEGERTDTTGQALAQFAELMALLYRGDIESAADRLPRLAETAGSHLYDHALVELSSRIQLRHVNLLYDRISETVREGSSSPLRERLLWQLAVMSSWISDSERPGLNLSRTEVVEHFEQLIVEFPRGFYAPYAREKLQHLEQAGS